MASRDHFTIKVRCPKCGNHGEARVSEDDYPFMKSPGFRVDRDADGFTYTQTGDSKSETKFKCLMCGVEAQ